MSVCLFRRAKVGNYRSKINMRSDHPDLRHDDGILLCKPQLQKETFFGTDQVLGTKPFSLSANESEQHNRFDLVNT